MASCAAYAALSSRAREPFHPIHHLYFFDLRIYRSAGTLVLHGAPLYDTEIGRFYFTYPPFAALMFIPLQSLPFIADEIIVTGFNIAALGALVLLTPGLARSRSEQKPQREHRMVPWALGACCAAAALWLEPVTTTLGYGQIDLIIALLIVWDLRLPDGALGKGAMIGLAGGLKLTPLIFIPYLLFSGRRRSAGLALAIFAATVAVGFTLLPSDASQYWSGLFLDSSRVG